jgi:hypothetical protein
MRHAPVVFAGRWSVSPSPTSNQSARTETNPTLDMLLIEQSKSRPPAKRG